MAEQEEKKASKEGSSHSVPALNKFMHPRNIYRTPPSFKQLASLYPNFRQFCTFDVSSKVHLDFSNPQALAELAIALLHKDFGLTVHLPSTHLVPTIPLRLNYLLWLQDVVNLWADRRKPDKFDLQQALLLQQAQKQEFLNQQQKENCEAMSQKAKDDSYYRSPVIGFDIGCGASCVYGLLGVKQCGFHMLCSDTDQEALSTARLNVFTNGLQQKIFVVESTKESLFSALQRPETLEFLAALRHKDGEVEPMDVDDSCSAEDAKGYLLDFTMCNPPFFSSEQETDSSSKSKKDRPPPNNAYTGRLHETVVEGGEVAFISRMIEESCQIKHKVRVFSTLVGAAADVKLVKQMLAAVSPAHSVVTEFCQGRTMRWGVAWTWCRDVCLEVVKSKKQISSVKPLLLNWPRTSHLSSQSVLGAWEAIDSWLRIIKLKAKVFKSSKYFVGASLKAYKVTWQNMRQRRRQENKKHAKPGSDCLNTDSLEGANTSDASICSPSEPDAGESNGQFDHKIDAKRRVSEAAVEDLEIDSRLNPIKKLKLETNDDEDQDDSDDDDNDGDHVDAQDEQINEDAHKDSVSVKQTGKPCLLKVNIFVKLVNNQVVVELHTLSGLLGREGANQLLTYLRNQSVKR